MVKPLLFYEPCFIKTKAHPSSMVKTIQVPSVTVCIAGQYGQIRYFAKVILERPWKSNVVTKKAFTVLSGLDLNFIPEAAVSVNTYMLCCLFILIAIWPCSTGHKALCYQSCLYGYCLSVLVTDILIERQRHRDDHLSMSLKFLGLQLGIEPNDRGPPF